jgi:UDP-N-acetylglucosamine--N-acetylmuramyl-(pentapeptide) pyrophosphoryl-undecaprenol N-acetylglucosamine transferase
VKIIMASDISGGHLFPAIAVAEELKARDRDAHILFVTGSREVAARIMNNENFPFILLPAFPKPRPVNYLALAFRLFQNFILSFIVLRKERPDIVVGFGGLLSVPMVVCAWLLGIPILIHEQNVTPGRANAFLSRFARRVAISFEESGSFFEMKDKLIFTGNPIRPSLRPIAQNKALGHFSLQPGRFTLFVMGGSQGAHSVNDAVLGMFEGLSPEERRGFQVIHIAGDADRKRIEEEYRKLKIDCKVYSFMDRIDSAYSASDLIISRAGASAISEITFLKKASILIPYPFARSHQMRNALYMAEHNRALVLEDDEGLAGRLKERIIGFHKDRSRLGGFSLAPEAKRSAASKVSELILNVIE